MKRDLLFGGRSESERCSAEGEVALDGCTVGGRVTFRGSTFTNPGAVALNLADATFSGNVFLERGFHARGQVKLGNARIGGYLNCGGGTFSHPATAAEPDAIALHLVNVEVGDSVLLHRGFRADGQVRMNRARIGGVLECSGGHFRNPGRYGLFARALRAGAGVLFGPGFVAEGGVRLTTARITGDLDCTGGTFGEGFQASGTQVSGRFRWRQVPWAGAG